MYDVAINIINYNTSKYTLECINSIIDRTSKSINYQIIVVDNNSKISDYKNLENNIPTQSNISLHRSNINTGFGGGNMFGSQFANAKYLLFLNNDALLLNDCINMLYNYMEKHPEIGLSSAQNYDENNLFHPSFDHYKSLLRLIFGRGFLEKMNPKKYPKRKKQYTKPLTVNWVNGAFLFFKASAFARIGGFDTNIFLYFEETDLCKRLEQYNYKTVLVPEAKILHYVNASSGQSLNIDRESLRSYLYVIKKHYWYLEYILIRIYLGFVFLLKPKKWPLLKVIFSKKGMLSSLKQQQKIVFLDSTDKKEA